MASNESNDGEEVTRDIIQRVKTAKNHYETLDVPKDCDDKVLKKAYRKLALKIHPDKCQAEGAEEAFKKVSNAYSCLSSSESRNHYDRFGSEAPAGSSGMPGGGVDPNEFFREFMRQNPDFAAGFQAGGGSTESGGFSVNNFDFSAGTLAAGKSWWKNKAETLPPWAQPPFRALGVLVFLVLNGFLVTMPYSAMLCTGVAVYLASQAVWWILNRAIWLLALGNLPPKLRPPFLLQVLIMVGAEYLGMVFDFNRGVVCCMTLWTIQHYVPSARPPPTAGSSSSSGFSFQAGGPQGFSFSTGPGFVQFGAVPGAGRPSVGGARQQPQHRRVHMD